MRIDEIIKRKPVDQELPYDNDKQKERMSRRIAGDEWRGPHEGRYLTLMLRGIKPAVLVYANSVEPFIKYIQNGIFSIFRIHNVPDKYEEYIITQSGEEWRAAKLQKLLTNKDKYFENNKESLYHARFGILMGYTNDDIRKFLNQDNASVAELVYAGGLKSPD